jgi:hypothetical protein
VVNCEYFKVGAFEVGIRLDVAECRDDFDVGVDLSTPPQLGSNHDRSECRILASVYANG